MTDQDLGGISPLQQMMASGAVAVVTSLFTTPLDVLEVHLQSQCTSVGSEPESLQTLEPLIQQIALLSPIHREVPPILQCCPGAPVQMFKWYPLYHMVS
ncbi:Solute carrier family 25 member 39 [Sciurus carolinensis]|uniref:Solute carrier family 25 member 39 n=1 Tax=Sciurus carolinensis TaxID=30640 RepID=A0AA41NH31_SCICA|nr:Solute carrier family 25 member 39 [Sciurus carolinensis]